MNKASAAIVLAMVIVLVMGYAANQVIMATHELTCVLKNETL